MKRIRDRLSPQTSGDSEHSPQNPQDAEAGHREPKVTQYPDGTKVQTNYKEDGKLASIVTRRPDGTGTIEVNGVEAEVNLDELFSP